MTTWMVLKTLANWEVCHLLGLIGTQFLEY
jgi:hypothetical protein